MIRETVIPVRTYNNMIQQDDIQQLPGFLHFFRQSDILRTRAIITARVIVGNNDRAGFGFQHFPEHHPDIDNRVFHTSREQPLARLYPASTRQRNHPELLVIQIADQRLPDNRTNPGWLSISALPGSSQSPAAPDLHGSNDRCGFCHPTPL